MKTNLEIYDSKKTYLYPNMTLAAPEDITNTFPAVNITKCVITTDTEGNMFYSVEPLSAMVNRLGADTSQCKSDEEILTLLENIIDNPRTPEPEITAQDRIAAALEYQNLLSM